jgi:hypothetical protein
MGSYGGLAVLLDEKEYFIENYILNAREYLLQEIPNMLDFISANSDHSLAASVFSLSLALLGLAVPKGGALNSKLQALTLALTWAFRRQKVTHIEGLFLPRGRAAVSYD